jgi:hypothetical protein
MLEKLIKREKAQDMKNNLWIECDQFVRKHYNQNFFWDCLNLTTRVWLGIMFKVIGDRLDKLEKNLEERTII